MCGDELPTANVGYSDHVVAPPEDIFIFSILVTLGPELFFIRPSRSYCLSNSLYKKPSYICPHSTRQYLVFRPQSQYYFCTTLNSDTPSIIIICLLGSIEYDIVLKFNST
jgi:hypothetical protein